MGTHRHVTFLLFLSMLSLAGISFADIPPTYTIGAPSSTLSLFSVYELTDTTRSLTIDDITSGRIDGRVASSRFYIRSTRDNYWFVFTLVNNSREPTIRFIRLDEPFISEVTMYLHEADGFHVYKSGLSQKIRDRVIYNRNPVFPVSFASGQSRTIYLKMHSQYSLVTAGIFVETQLSFQKMEHRFIAGYFLYFGIALALILYNLFLSLSLHGKIYAYYYLHELCYALFVLVYSGFDLYFGVAEPIHYMMDSSSGFAIFFFILFSRSLLQTKEYFKIIDKFLRIIIILVFIGSVLILIDIRLYCFLVILFPFVVFFMLFLGIYALCKKVETAPYYLAAMGFYFIGLFFIAAVNSCLIPYNLVTRYLFIPGSASEMIIFSLLLAYRTRLLEKENRAYQEERIQAEREAKIDLERIVKERTSELQNVNRQLELLSRTDSLSGLNNRRVFDEQFEREWRRSKRTGAELCIIMCDIDWFKDYNDSYGHLMGDECIRNVAHAIEKVLRRNFEVAARYGGEEFVVILPVTDIHGGEVVAENIRHEVEELHILYEQSPFSRVTISLGVASMYPRQNVQKDLLLDYADQALYQSKQRGRNRVTVYGEN